MSAVIDPPFARLQLPEKLAPLFEPRRYKVLHGGRGGGKSWSVAAVLLAMAADRPLRILCAREIQKSIKQSVHQLLKDVAPMARCSCFPACNHTRSIRSNLSRVWTLCGLRKPTASARKVGMC